MKTDSERKAFWNDRYAGNGYVYGEQPNIFLKQQLDRLEPGKLLLPAEGEGRNAIYAAHQGWEVDAFDISEKARKKAMKRAKSEGVDIHYIIASAEEFDPGTVRYDAIGLIYLHLPSAIRKGIHRKLVNALKPGGKLILEAFSEEQLNNNSGGPKNVDMLYSRENLVDDFNILNSVTVQNVEEILSEGPYHKGKANIIRVLGEK